MRDKYRAARTAIGQGFVDGWFQPYDLSSGMTWTERNLWANNLYDRFVNVGQRTRRLVEEIVAHESKRRGDNHVEG